jgi:quercetin dioxygenase-like cupin family protein
VSDDVIDWSRLIGEHEAGTFAMLRRHRKALIDPRYLGVRRSHTQPSRRSSPGGFPGAGYQFNLIILSVSSNYRVASIIEVARIGVIAKSLAPIQEGQKMTEKLASFRSVVNVNNAEFVPYGLQGTEQSDLTWCNISYDEDTGQGSFLIRFKPGAKSINHEHVGYEELLVLDGELEDSDGTIYKQNDFISLRPGSKHCSVSHTGCTLAVFIRGGFRTLDEAEPVHT